MLKKISIILIAILVLLGLGSVVNAENSFSLEPNSVNVGLNGTKTILYSGGTGSITWTSGDPTIATVNEGTISGLKIGETTITATRGSETATCTVKVVYTSIQIGANESNSVSNVNLVLNEHDSENLIAKVKDGNYAEVNGATVNWRSSDTSIVTIDNAGKLTAVKAGTATITAEAAGVTDTCEVTVYDAPDFTDFSNAKYETSLNASIENLKISGITPKDSIGYNYYYMITSSNTKPELNLKHGSIDREAMEGKIGYLSVNAEENYVYTRKLSEYVELNQDLYLWVIQESKLQNSYYDTNSEYVSYATKFVVEGEKLDRASMPPLNLILQSFNIGYWVSSSSSSTDNYTNIRFNFPSATQNRKFTLKVGKITDNTILTKIQNNDYTGITDLLEYAKNNTAIYSKELTTTDTAYFRSDDTLFDGRSLLEHKAYYFIYVKFDDENGKYYPVEGVTLGQAWFASTTDSWNLLAYTSSDFKWENLSSTYTPSANEGKDPTTSPVGIPKAGKNAIITISIFTISIIGVIFYKKYSNYKDIK